MKKKTIISAVIIALTGIIITLVTVIICSHFQVEATITIAIIESITTIIVTVIPIIIELINKKKNNNSSIIQEGHNNDAKIFDGSEGDINQNGNGNKASIGNKY